MATGTAAPKGCGAHPGRAGGAHRDPGGGAGAGGKGRRWPGFGAADPGNPCDSGALSDRVLTGVLEMAESVDLGGF